MITFTFSDENGSIEGVLGVFSRTWLQTGLDILCAVRRKFLMHDVARQRLPAGACRGQLSSKRRSNDGLVLRADFVLAVVVSRLHETGPQFSYVCPEPVLAKCSFLHING